MKANKINIEKRRKHDLSGWLAKAAWQRSSLMASLAGKPA